MTTNSENPASKYLGTTWQKIEGRFLLGTSGSGASKQTGGNMTKTIAQANLPNVKLIVDSFTATIQTSRFSSATNSQGGGNNLGTKTIPANGTSSALTTGGSGGDYWRQTTFTNTQENKISTSVNPQTSALGSGQALDITPSYYTCHIWLRLT